MNLSPDQPHGSPASPITVRTQDGVRLRGLSTAIPVPAVSPAPEDTTADLCFVICHGMTNATGKDSSRAAIDAFGQHAATIALDFRGHGESDGRSSVGRTEVMDVDAAVGRARDLGYRRVVVVGFSMGGAVALRHAGLIGARGRVGERALVRAELDEFGLAHRPDAVVSVSSPSRWFSRESVPMRRIQWLLEHPLGKLVAPRLGIRLGEPWVTVPLTPLELVADIAPTPLLIVHGGRDHYFDAERGRELHRAAPESEFWLIPELAHAESSITGGIIDRIAHWAIEVT